MPLIPVILINIDFGSCVAIVSNYPRNLVTRASFESRITSQLKRAGWERGESDETYIISRLQGESQVGSNCLHDHVHQSLRRGYATC